MAKPVILVVDDEPDNFDVIDAFLDDQGYSLHYAANGDQALTSVDVVKPDLILLDVMMPGQDGFQVCQTLKKLPRWRQIPVIMVTALASKEDLAQCLNAGADDFIGKPVSRLELQARVRSMLRIKSQYDTIQWFSNSQRDTINMLGKNLTQLSTSIARSLPHEINTPLNGLLGTIQILQEDLEQLSPAEIRELLATLAAMAGCLDQLLQKFLTYVELELATTPGQAPYRSDLHTQVEPGRLTAKLLAQAGPRQPDLTITLEPAQLPLSATYLETLLSELLSNALKFSAPGTPVTIQAKTEAKQWTVTITDQGRGLSKSQIAEIKPFQQFDRQATDAPGIGLGLKIVQKIVELANGRFGIESVPQEKTSVTIALPLTP